MPALVYALVEVRKVDNQKIREGMLAAARSATSASTCDAVCGRGRPPCRDRRGVVDGCGIGRYGARRTVAGGRRMLPNRRWSITWA